MSNVFLAYYHLLYKYFQPLGSAIVATGLLLTIGSLLQVTTPKLLGYFIDTITQRGFDPTLMQTALWFIALGILTQLATIGVSYLSQKVAWQATNALRIDLLAHCLALDLALHKTISPGEFVDRVDGDTAVLSRFFSQLVLQFVGNGMILIGVLVILFGEDWQAGTSLSLFVGISLFVLVTLQRHAIASWRVYRQWSGVFYGFIGEHFAGREDIKGNGAVGYTIYQFHQILRGWLPVFHRARFTSTLLWGSSIGLFTIGNTIALILAVLLTGQQRISLGSAYLIFYYTNLLAQPIEKIRQELEEFQQVEASIYRIKELFQMHSHIPDRGEFHLREGALSVVFDRVDFCYQETPTLQDISFTLEAGQVLGIVGSTGSGKTTIGRLLLRLYDVQNGGIFLDGKDIRLFPLSELRTRIGIVSQTVQLLQANVRDNLTFFDQTIADNEIMTTLNLIGLYDWFHRLPKGLDTPLHPDQLSAGEAQLLALARVFLRNPGLIILDEASSRLDPKTEAELDKAIGILLQGRSGIVIAHHLATLERVQHVLVLEHGKIINFGTKEQVMPEIGWKNSIKS